MQNEICSVYHLSIAPSNFGAFSELVQSIVAATGEEPDTTIYEYVVNADHTVVHIIERYRSHGLLPHVEQRFAPYAEQFLRLATVEKLFVYGETTPEIRATLDDFAAEYFTSFAGFSRWKRSSGHDALGQRRTCGGLAAAGPGPGAPTRRQRHAACTDHSMRVDTSMRAIVLHAPGGPEALTIEDRPVPEPRRGEVLIAVEAFGLNRSDCSRDRAIRRASPFWRRRISVLTLDVITRIIGTWSAHCVRSSGRTGLLTARSRRRFSAFCGPRRC